MHGPNNLPEQVINYAIPLLQMRRKCIRSGQLNFHVIDPGSMQPAITVQSPGLYWLQVKNSVGCVGKDSIIIFSKQCLSGVYIPTAFTPNNDGKNDILKVIVHGNALTFSLKVYDRAGQLIFQTSDPEKGWDGKYKGLPVPVAIYVWQCSYQLEGSKPMLQKGTLGVIR